MKTATKNKSSRSKTKTQGNESVSNQNRRDKDFYIQKAAEPNTRVIEVNTADTYILTDLAIKSDQGIRRMRNQIMRTVKPEVFIELNIFKYDILYGLIPAK